MISHFSGHVAILGGPPIRSQSLRDAIDTCPLPLTELKALPSAAGSEARYDPYKAKIAYGRELTGGEIACAQLHLRAYAQFVKTNAQWLLVLEDDAIIKASWNQILALAKLNAGNVPTENNAIISLYSTTFVDESSAPGNNLVRLKVPPSHTVGYWINRSASIYALAQVGEIFTSADWPPWAVNVDFFRQKGALMIEHPVGTTIANREGTERWSKSRRLFHLAVWFLVTRTRPQAFRTRSELFKFVMTPIRRRLGQRVQMTQSQREMNSKTRIASD